MFLFERRSLAFLGKRHGLGHTHIGTVRKNRSDYYLREVRTKMVRRHNFPSERSFRKSGLECEKYSIYTFVDYQFGIL